MDKTENRIKRPKVGFFLCVLLSISASTFADGIKGRLLIAANAPADGVAVVLQTKDSVFVDAVISDAEGRFGFNKPAGHYILHFQHLLFESLSIHVTDGELGDIYLKEKDHRLSEVAIVAERPQIKVENGALVFDMRQLIKSKPAANAFEAIKELPGVTGTDNSVQLIGANSLDIVINGKTTSMPVGQLIAMLKAIPVSRVLQTEVMYNPPARYNVKGALINVIIEQKKEAGNLLQGEVGAELRQYHYTRGNAHANLLYSTPRFSADVIVNADAGKRYGGEDIFSRHTLNGQATEINQKSRSKSNNTKGTFRLGLEYDLKNKDQLSFAYYAEASDYDSRRTALSLFDTPAEARRTDHSRIKIDGDDMLHNAQLQFKGHNGLIAGIEYMNYESPETQDYLNASAREDVTEERTVLTDSRQDIAKWNGFISQSLSLKNKLNLSFGANAGYSKAKTKVGYDYSNSGGGTYNYTYYQQKETESSFFGEVSRNFGRTNMKFSLKAEHFRSRHRTESESTDLWNEWALFPNATISYRHSPSKLWQFNFTSSKKYPSYWAVNPQTTYLNAYSVTTGNPQLKPSRSYNMQLMFILRQKYIFMAFCQYDPDRIMQLPYQSKDELRNVFRYENFDHRLLSGISVITPVKIGRFFSSRIIMQGMCIQDKKADFYDIPIDNKKIFGRVELNNTITLSEAKPNLKWTVSGYYVTPAIQGIYRLGDYYDVSTGLKWQFAQNKGSVILKYNNIFKSNMPNPSKIDAGNQYNRLTTINTSSYAGLAFSWSFGKYKPKTYKNIDDSRLGR